MSEINLDEINANSLYDADAIAALFGIHRVSVHRQVFPRVRVQRIGRKDRTTGAELIRYARGESVGGDNKVA
jgi:hypothetical protein